MNSKAKFRCLNMQHLIVRGGGAVVIRSALSEVLFWALMFFINI